jgi:hypothetical protein
MASIPAHLVFAVSQASLRQSRLLNSNCARPAEDFTNKAGSEISSVRSRRLSLRNLIVLCDNDGISVIHYESRLSGW